MNHVGWQSVAGRAAVDAPNPGVPMTAKDKTPDPQWALTLAIRTSLELHGEFAAEVDERDAQSVVDLHWAARQAGRLLGQKVNVEFGAADGPADYIVPATVRGVDDGGQGRVHADEGLQRLLRAVQATQQRSCAPPAPSRVRRPQHAPADSRARG